MQEPEGYIHLYAMAGNHFFEKHTHFMATQEVATSSYEEIRQEAARTLAAINAIRVSLDRYEADLLKPFLQTPSVKEQLV